MVKSLSGLSTFRPFPRMVARWAPRAMKLKSKPAWASLPPKYHPMAPAPMTAIFMSLFPDCS